MQSLERWIDPAIEAQLDAAGKQKLRFLSFERAVKELPGSYKLWRTYLLERIKLVEKLCITDPQYEIVNDTFDRALVFLYKMPRIWLMYIEFLMKQCRITRARRAVDNALRSLPITQHARIWELWVRYIKEGKVPKETALCAFRRYLMLEPDHVEIYIAYLRTIGHFNEAAELLSAIVDDEEFSSMEGKTRHQLWMDLCDLVSKHPAEIKSLNIEAIIRSGIRQFTDEVGRLWISLGDHFIRLGQFEKARDVYEEAMSTVSTVHDFSLIFDAYSKFLESLITAHMERQSASAAIETDLLIARLDDLLERRPELISSVKLRQNPHNIHEWLQRVKIYKDVPEKVIKCFTEAVMTVDPQKAEGRLWTLWSAFAKFYEAHDDLANARVILEKATQVNYRAVDDLASVWCDWVEMELRHHKYDDALKVSRKAVGQRKAAALKDKESVQARIGRAKKLWALSTDLEESLGTLETTRSAYDTALELKVATPALVLSYAKLLEERKYFEEAFKVYERGIKAFGWPHVNDIWLVYLSQFVARYGARKLERARDLFEQAVEKAPPKFARRLYMLYAKLEEEHGLARHALAIYNRATKAVEEKDMYEMYSILLRKTAELFGQTRTREIFEQAIESLPQDRIKDACVRYAKMETMLGEVDRARGIYNHASQFCDPRKVEDFWNTWRGFEVQHGNEDTFRDMLRVKRSVQATYAHVHFNATEIAEEASAEVLDPMTAAEEALKGEEEDRKRAGGALGGDASKRQRTTADAATARKELLAGFEPSDRFKGVRPGFVFKLGVKGLGYYEDASIAELEAKAAARAEAERRAAAAARQGAAQEKNPEEIDLDMDLDDEEEDEGAEGGGAASTAAPPEAERRAAAAARQENPEEIDLDLDDED